MSDPDHDGDMGVSSERVGPTGPDQVGTTGIRDVSPPDGNGAGDDAVVRQREPAVDREENPDPPSEPVAGHPSKNPASADHPFETP